MDRTKIEYCKNPDGTQGYKWNPIRGCSGIGCVIKDKCWARGMNNRFHYIEDFNKPEIDYKTLASKMPKKPSRILTCFMGDFFGEGVRKSWRKKVYDVIEHNPKHTYFILTKHPYGMFTESNLIPKNVFLGATINKGSDLGRLADLVELRYFNKNIFVSFEPLLSFIDISPDWWYAIDWIIIGGMQRGAKPRPKAEWIKNILDQAKKRNIPVWMKNNLKSMWPGKLRQEFPK